MSADNLSDKNIPVDNKVKSNLRAAATTQNVKESHYYKTIYQSDAKLSRPYDKMTSLYGAVTGPN